MKPYATYKIAPEHEGLTVESYLKQILHCSGRKLQKLTRLKGITLNGKSVYLQRKVKAGDSLRIQNLADTTYGVQPEPGPIDILYEDDYMIVVNKPAQQLVHPAGQTTNGTLANYLAYELAQRNIVATIRPVHRLDRDTSGCVVFAKDARSQSILEQQMQANQFKRIYWALVSGVVSPSAGTINAPIGPHPTMPNRRAVREDGEPAVTHYRTISTYADASLLELSLDTGKTHQIRVHLAHLGYPIIGDGMYGKRSHWIARQALHAISVSFIHLRENREISVAAPLPQDFSKAIAWAGDK